MIKIICFSLKYNSFCRDVRLSILVNNYWPPLDKYDVIPDITFEKLKSFSTKVLQNLYIKCLVQGNVMEDIAMQTTNSFVKSLNYESLITNTYPKVSCFFFPYGKSV